MPVSHEVRKYYAERIFALMGRDGAPPNFVPLDLPVTGRSTVEGCRGGGKNIVEFGVHVDGDRIADLRVSCGLCNPAMYVAADILVTWSRGRTVDELLALDPRDRRTLAPWYEVLGGPGMPDDAREKFQYALLGIQNALRDHRGEPPLDLPEIDEPTTRDWADEDEDEYETP